MPAFPPNARLDIGLMGLLGIEVAEATLERVVVTMEVTERHLQPFGYLHGGVSVVLIETAASVGGYLHAPEGHAAFGLEVNANHLRSVASGVQLRAEAVPMHVGRTTQVWSVEVRNPPGQLVCIGRCTLAVVERPERRAAR